MLPVDLIAAKRDGHELTTEQISEFIRGTATDDIPDYQVAAMAMAVYLQGMTSAETTALTHAMLNSGSRLEWPDDGRVRVDKHSTGGIGDKTSLILAPLLAAIGLQVPMLSGRGLGPTGGTLDKLEAIPGFRTNLSISEIHRLTLEVGCVITGTTRELAPADRRLYAIRDVTATVPSIPLITSSILSKKLAESLQGLVLDVKFGSGAFMKTPQAARALARSLVDVCSRLGTPATALLTNMNHPLGSMCGNALEVRECLDVLSGKGPADVRTLTLELAAELLLLSRFRTRHHEALAVATKFLDSGHAMDVFQRMVHSQGGQLDHLPQTPATSEFVAWKSGSVEAIDTEQLGLALIELGAGRRRLNDVINPSAGLEMLITPGSPVTAGQPLVRIFSQYPEPASQRLRQAIHIGDGPPTELPPLILERLAGNT
ncbi:MAG: thymidine phosphorylase [Planctomycetota bacterium]